MDTDTQVFRFLLNKGQLDPQQYHHVEEIAQAINRSRRKNLSAVDVEKALHGTRYRMAKNVCAMVPGHEQPYEIVEYKNGDVSARACIFAIRYPQDYGWKE
ncbi:hypothetical protein TUM18999_03070 [Pseudomonas tohonis]|uniref:Uncharacterized protein n=1 Tax=Pseudomonas tohonis TaxID=2725477 RepID=A0A6J4DYI7_9PSED|nr:hypothetical protein TUM18999_03070 [Pseudomonas tohonis]